MNFKKFRRPTHTTHRPQTTQIHEAAEGGQSAQLRAAEHSRGQQSSGEGGQRAPAEDSRREQEGRAQRAGKREREFDGMFDVTVLH